MKKIFYIFILLCCGCINKELNIETLIENNNNVYIAMTYPKIGISSFDKVIANYIKKEYETFKKESFDYLETEFNLDYEYLEVNQRYINVTLKIFLNNASLIYPVRKIKTFVFDIEKNKMVSLKDILDETTLKKLVPILKQKLLQQYSNCVILNALQVEITPDFNNFEFVFDHEKMTFYFNPNRIASEECGVISISIPLEELGLNFNVKQIAKEISLPISSRVIDLEKPVVAITFDDGPSKYTNQILDVLKNNDANATFFVLGNKVKAYSSTIQRMILEGNEVGNHSYNHKWLTKLDKSEIKEQIENTQSLIYEISGYTPRLLRPTYGSINKKVKESTDLDIVLWDVDSLDWKIKDSKKIASRVLKDVEDLDIILFHDVKQRTIKAVEIVISKLKEEGFQFVTVSELETIKILRKNS